VDCFYTWRSLSCGPDSESCASRLCFITACKVSGSQVSNRGHDSRKPAEPGTQPQSWPPRRRPRMQDSGRLVLSAHLLELSKQRGLYAVHDREAARRRVGFSLRVGGPPRGFFATHTAVWVPFRGQEILTASRKPSPVTFDRWRLQLGKRHALPRRPHRFFHALPRIWLLHRIDIPTEWCDTIPL